MDLLLGKWKKKRIGRCCQPVDNSPEVVAKRSLTSLEDSEMTLLLSKLQEGGNLKRFLRYRALPDKAPFKSQ